MTPRIDPTLKAASPAHAVDLLRARVRPVGTEVVELSRSHGRVLAEAVRSDRPSPAVDVSAMDGYAVRLGDQGRVRVAGEIRIGQAPPEMPAGGVLRIVTGAPVPAGAEAVVKREDVTEGEDHIEIGPKAAADVRASLNIRRRGENLQAGTEAVAAGSFVTAPVAGTLASFGVTRVRVFRRVRVSVLSTGDEVIAPSDTPTPWQLRDGNSSALAGLLGSTPWIGVEAMRHAPDDPAAILAAARELLKHSDALVLTGGVSMGDRDFVPGVVRELGGSAVFHRVPQRPGGPVLGAVLGDGRPILGLPGNPLSVLCTGRRLLAPVLRGQAGMSADGAVPSVTLASHDDRRLDMWWFRLVRLVGPGIAELVAPASSGDFAAAARADGFVEIPPGQAGLGPWPYYGWSI